MKILTFSSLYPSSARQRHGVFVENRLRHLIDHSSVEAQVVSPVPWFPSRHPCFGEYAQMAATPREDERHGIHVHHPRYLLLPKVGMGMAPRSMAMASLGLLRRLREKFPFQLIDAHYFYPDGVAAITLGKRLGVPVVITARGTDLNLIPQHPRPRRLIQWAASEAAGMITVCQALKDVLVDLDVPAGRVQVLRNGVDLSIFRPPEGREALRQALGIDRPCLLSVGHLITRKGHDLVIRALQALPDMMLAIAGDGPEEGALRELVVSLGLTERVRFLGALPHAGLKDWYGAADCLVLASSREGWANVLLESMACGTPVVATRVWGTPEVVAVDDAGRLAERTPVSLAAEVRALLASPPSRTATRAYAEGFSWDATSQGQKALFERVLAEQAA
ncbi:MAG: glycosyltransferase family 4 protein [Gammaproteobacteria bacterium]|nr:glycosyltransferase family 4 protein [Gammaproteobacteria bacterium]MCF6364471.1 glycosyltransferase family 4 protein [Gammaproteobacteria bacterium]